MNANVGIFLAFYIASDMKGAVGVALLIMDLKQMCLTERVTLNELLFIWITCAKCCCNVLVVYGEICCCCASCKTSPRKISIINLKLCVNC